MKKRNHWWLVVDRETGIAVAHRTTRKDARSMRNAVWFPSGYKVIKVVQAPDNKPRMTLLMQATV